MMSLTERMNRRQQSEDATIARYADRGDRCLAAQQTSLDHLKRAAALDWPHEELVAIAAEADRFWNAAQDAYQSAYEIANDL